MNRYNIRIDGEIMPDSYTYEELLLNDILDFVDIEIKKESEYNWTKIEFFYFPEEQEEGQTYENDFYIAEDGQVHFNGQLEEFRNNKHKDAEGHTNLDMPSRINSHTTNNISGSSDNIGWKIMITILIIIIFIAITCTIGWWSIPAGIIGYCILMSVWGM